MRSPEGEDFDNTGCYLEVSRGKRLVFTDALGPGWRPQTKPFMTAEITMTPEGSSTRYRAVARHCDEEGRKAHEQMGFLDGWGKALDQLVEFIKARGETI
jgi:uncharacterized protein YndB with AHSA1/START domain